MNYPLVKDLIPQREPFLFVDKILEFDESKPLIKTVLKLSGKEDFFRGHFPDNPVMPGVLLQEALFQSAAALMSLLSTNKGLGVVTRVKEGKFRSLVKPLDELIMEVELVEKISNACFMKGVTKVNGKTVLVLEFTVAEI